jgi:hypothetical protein
MDPRKSETRFDICQAKKDPDGRITDASVINVYINLPLDLSKRYWRLFGDRRNLIHDNVGWADEGRTIPNYTVALALLNDDTLCSMS